MRGSTFIEILVSLLLLSLMLLGLDAAQLTALRETKTSYYYAVAMQQLHNMQENLRVLHGANPDEQIQQWNQQNATVLPLGRGVVEDGVVSVFWGKISEETCSANKIGLSGCVTSDINMEHLSANQDRH